MGASKLSYRWALCSITHATKEMHWLRDHAMPLQPCSPAFARPPLGCNAAWWRPAGGTSVILFLRNRFRKAESSRGRGINRAAYHLQHLRIR